MMISPGDSNEKVAELIKKLQEYDPNSEILPVDEARELVKRSEMLIFSSWEMSSSFLLDQIRRQDKSISFEVNITREFQGFDFNVDAQIMAVWSFVPKLDKQGSSMEKEMKKTYVLEQRMVALDNEVKTLKTVMRPAT